ncbi:MAG: sugar kinase [Betaproteobacteria bacterium]|nr:sugar kinase [Betaproteobacteria bacterium]
MPGNVDRKVVLVTRHTRLEELVTRYHTLAQARFYIEHLGADFNEYVKEHDNYLASKRTVLEVLTRHGRYQAIDRSFLPNFLFGPEDVVVALGQDGVVANIMKYLDGHPLIGVNPDPYRFDGVLLPFEPRDLAPILDDTLNDRRAHKAVTMAMARLTDSQVLYAVNDLFIGPRSHTSARYEIKLGDATEIQSSSGIIVSTGLGSTGWMKSVVTGSLAVAKSLGSKSKVPAYQPQAWDTDHLVFAVREPFPSKSSAATLIYGAITKLQPLVLASRMPENGVIFSDGIEADRLEFNAGAVAKVEVADRQGRLVV